MSYTTITTISTPVIASLYGYVYVISTHTTYTGRFAKSPYYQQSVEALRRHQLACRLLGEPLRFQTLRVGDQRNWVTTEEVHVRMYICCLYQIMCVLFGGPRATKVAFCVMNYVRRKGCDKKAISVVVPATFCGNLQVYKCYYMRNQTIFEQWQIWCKQSPFELPPIKSQDYLYRCIYAICANNCA